MGNSEFLRRWQISYITQQLLAVHYLKTKRFDNIVHLSSDIVLIINETLKQLKLKNISSTTCFLSKESRISCLLCFVSL